MNRQETYESTLKRLGSFAKWLAESVEPIQDMDSLTVVMATIATLRGVLASSAELQSAFLSAMNLFWAMAEDEHKEDYKLN